MLHRCKICFKEFTTSSQLGGHVGSHKRQGRTYSKKWSTNNCRHCGKQIISRKKSKYCSLSCLGKYKKALHDNKPFVVCHHVIDKTRLEILTYKEKQQVCEICGNVEKAITGHKNIANNLSVDHDHTTNKFRGLLCTKCNIQLGWYEQYAEQVKAYLNKTLF